MFIGEMANQDWAGVMQDEPEPETSDHARQKGSPPIWDDFAWLGMG